MFKSTSLKAIGLLYIITSSIFFGCVAWHWQKSSSLIEELAENHSLYFTPFIFICFFFFIYGLILLLKKNYVDLKHDANHSYVKYRSNYAILISNLVVIPAIGLWGWFSAAGDSGFGAIGILVIGILIAVGYFALTILIYLFFMRICTNGGKSILMLANKDILYKNARNVYPLILLATMFLVSDVFSGMITVRNDNELQSLHLEYNNFIEGLPLGSSLEKIVTFINTDSQKKRSRMSSSSHFVNVPPELSAIFENCEAQRIDFYASYGWQYLLYLDEKLVYKHFQKNFNFYNFFSKELFELNSKTDSISVCNTMIDGQAFKKAIGLNYATKNELREMSNEFE